MRTKLLDISMQNYLILWRWRWKCVSSQCVCVCVFVCVWKVWRHLQFFSWNKDAWICPLWEKRRIRRIHRKIFRKLASRLLGITEKIRPQRTGDVTLSTELYWNNNENIWKNFPLLTQNNPGKKSVAYVDVTWSAVLPGCTYLGAIIQICKIAYSWGCNTAYAYWCNDEHASMYLPNPFSMIRMRDKVFKQSSNNWILHLLK